MYQAIINTPCNIGAVYPSIINENSHSPILILIFANHLPNDNNQLRVGGRHEPLQTSRNFTLLTGFH